LDFFFIAFACFIAAFIAIFIAVFIVDFIVTGFDAFIATFIDGLLWHDFFLDAFNAFLGCVFFLGAAFIGAVSTDGASTAIAASPSAASAAAARIFWAFVFAYMVEYSLSLKRRRLQGG